MLCMPFGSNKSYSWAHDIHANFSNVYTIGAASGTFVSIPGSNVGVGKACTPLLVAYMFIAKTMSPAVNFYTGCSDNGATSCTTGGGKHFAKDTLLVRMTVGFSEHKQRPNSFHTRRSTPTMNICSSLISESLN